MIVLMSKSKLRDIMDRLSWLEDEVASMQRGTDRIGFDADGGDYPIGADEKHSGAHDKHDGEGHWCGD